MSITDQAIVIYKPDDLDIEIPFKGELERRTVWGTQKQIAETLNIDVSVVSRHVQNYKRERGARAERDIAGYAITASDGKTYTVEHYNTNVILYVGFRANASKHVMAFQDWIARIIDDYFAQRPAELTPLQQLRAFVDALETQEAAIQETAFELLLVKHDVADDRQRIEVLETITQSNAEYFTVVGYYNLRKLGSLTKYEAQTIGRNAARLSRERGVAIKDIPNSEHGTVHTYHVSILDEITTGVKS